MRKGRTRLRWVSQLMIRGSREWDDNVLSTCFFNHDIQEVKKIRLSNRIDEDVVAWFYEKSGMFSVRSAYRIVVQHDQEITNQAGSSSRPDGAGPLLKGIWAAQVPTKVRIFTWRLFKEGLAT
jgi:hypothetical protein